MARLIVLSKLSNKNLLWVYIKDGRMSIEHTLDLIWMMTTLVLQIKILNFNFVLGKGACASPRGPVGTTLGSVSHPLDDINWHFWDLREAKLSLIDLILNSFVWSGHFLMDMLIRWLNFNTSSLNIPNKSFLVIN